MAYSVYYRYSKDFQIRSQIIPWKTAASELLLNPPLESHQRVNVLASSAVWLFPAAAKWISYLWDAHFLSQLRKEAEWSAVVEPGFSGAVLSLPCSCFPLYFGILNALS